MQLAAIIVSLVLIVVGVALFGRALLQIFNFMRLGQPVPAGTRTNDPTQRTVTVAKEFLGHTRMNRWGIVGVAHWFVAVGFFSLLLTIVNAIGQRFKIKGVRNSVNIVAGLLIVYCVYLIIVYPHIFAH